MMGKKQEIDFSWKEAREPGIYVCSACGLALFGEEKKFDSGTGFPSFWLALNGHVEEKQLNTYGRSRIQVLCRDCGQHLGHLFPNKVTPGKIRYCINADAIELKNG